MNVLQQYINIYKSNTELINANSAPAINALRQKACKQLETAGLPKVGSENYQHTDLQSLLSTDYGINLARVKIDINPEVSFKCDVPNLSTALFMLLNDRWGETEISRRQLPEGVLIGSLATMATQYPEIANKYYGKIADLNNPLVALNTMLAQDGLFFYIPKGVKIEKPIQLVDILQNVSPLMAVRRLLIIAEDDTVARLLICDHTQNTDVELMSLQTIEIYAGCNAQFDLYDLEESSHKTTRLSTTYATLMEGSNVMIDGITLYNGNTRNEYYCTFAGKKAELHLLGMAITDSNRKVDSYSLINHNVPDCHSNELFKYVADDNSTASFAGRIYVAPGATKTEAYQANRNIVGSDTAHIYSKPQLEIYNDDVKCSHGSAIGQLDEMQLFYMRTRGLSEESARLLLKQAFLADVIDGIRLDPLRDRLRQLIDRRFSGIDTSCTSCASDCRTLTD
jgi:Fe-S cluster assembly protein SufD